MVFFFCKQKTAYEMRISDWISDVCSSDLLVISYLTLSQIGGDAGVLGGFARLTTELPEKFDMILSQDNPFYKDLPGLSVLIGGMWIANLSYWGFNQYIIQRALAAKNLGEAQKGVVFAAFLKLLMPVIIVLPGIAAVLLAPDLAKPDQAYPTMRSLLPVGLLGLVFAALVAAIIASTASKINSVATIFTLDLYAKMKRVESRAQDAGQDADLTSAHERQLVFVGRITAVVATLLAIFTARPLLGSLDQAFQYIQEFSGFVTPGITVIFLLGRFWPRAADAGELVGAVASVLFSLIFWFPAEWGGIAALSAVTVPERIGTAFFASLALAVFVSLA